MLLNQREHSEEYDLRKEGVCPLKPTEKNNYYCCYIKILFFK
jgi:hypothetical protein